VSGRPTHSSSRQSASNATARVWVTLTSGNVLRFLRPLTISDDLLHEGLDILERAFVANA
jgi:4-aminobutyrate aminotransferase/(S)-3-amino-2-methylpropionate transaminase